MHRLPKLAGVVCVSGLVAALGLRSTLEAGQSSPAPSSPVPRAAQAAPRAGHQQLVTRYCLGCHDDASAEAGLSLDGVVDADVAAHPEVWEKVVRKLRARRMPPVGEPRPDEALYDAAIADLETALDRHARTHPNPGRTATIRRLTRTEYRNAVRDLLAVDVDVASLLPPDESSYGFDNVTVGDLSPTLLDRYISAAEKISRLAVGRPSRSPGGETIRTPPDLTQEDHIEGLPLGTRGGVVLPYTFPVDGEYEIQIRLRRDRDEKVEGLGEPHEVEISVDRARAGVFTVQPPRRVPDLPDDKQPSHETVDQHLKARVPVTAGSHVVGVAFIKKPTLVAEGQREPYQARFNSLRHPRIQPAIYSVSIVGPYAPRVGGDTPSRRKLFVAKAAAPAEEDGAARRILSHLIHRAYRRPATPADLVAPMNLYRQGRSEGDFDAGIEMAVSGVLVSPEFLFRVERDPAGVKPHTPYRVSDLALASRLSFFLWSSIPDDALLAAAEAGTLHQPAVLERQVRRMLADPRSRTLIDNFAAQWLQLRNLDAITPDMRLFPDFDDNLRRALGEETELFIDSVLREDRSVLDLLKADYTFVNERLAKHYGIPNVYGTRFRRVTPDAATWRGGLLRQGSVLTVTSYATRTSPVLRGKWVLENILGVPPPPPPPNVPALKDNTVDGSLSGRRRLAEHRKNAVCARCHNVIDPVGLSLEKFDAVGRRRTFEDGAAVDATGGLPDGSTFSDVDGLETAILKRPELFVETLAERLMTYALGRGVESYDAPAIRAIVHDAAVRRYRISDVILGVVNSQPFQMRMSR